MTTLRKNAAANFLGRVWGAISIYIFVPLYLRFLGIEAYGMVGFYSILLGIFLLADMGLSATLNREMARLSVRGDTAHEVGDSVRTYEFAYLFVSLAVASTIWFLAPFFAERWLNTNSLSLNEMITAIRLMGIAVAFQLPSGLYFGGLLGLQKQVLANSVQVGWGIMRGVGGVLILWLISPTIIAFSLWQLISNATYCYSIRRALWRKLPFTPSKPRVNWLLWRGTWKYSLGMASITVLSTILMQTDKLVVSKILTLEAFGYYSLAGSLAMAPIILASSIGLAVFPRMTGFVSLGDLNSLSYLYHKACSLISLAVIPGAMTLVIFSGDFILAWTGSASAVKNAAVVAQFLLGGQLLQAITVVPFYLALAHGQTRIILITQIAMVLIIIPLLIHLIENYGSVGGGISWFVVNLIILPFYMLSLHRRFMPGELRAWALRDIGRPLIVAAPIILMSHLLLPLPSSRILMICQIITIWFVSVLATVISISNLRADLGNMLKNLFLHSTLRKVML